LGRIEIRRQIVERGLERGLGQLDIPGEELLPVIRKNEYASAIDGFIYLVQGGTWRSIRVGAVVGLTAAERANQHQDENEEGQTTGRSKPLASARELVGHGDAPLE
jgi:hypothetical protein